MIGRSTKFEKTGSKEDLGVGKTPSSKKDPMGKGQGPINKTGKTFYGNCTGKADRGSV